MTPKMKPRIYKGTRDFLPEQMIKRNFVIDTVKDVFEKFGFEPLETPTLELWETLSGKYGDEGDRLTYRFTDRGKREVGLRYDLTVPLARVMAMYPEISKPFKRYQIQPVWRADKPQKGRFREFYQCDIDVIGSSSMLADAEIISAIHEILVILGFRRFEMRINSRKILSGIVQVAGIESEKETEVARSIDKMDKIGREGVRKELKETGFSDKQLNIIFDILDITGTNREKLVETATILKDSESGMMGIQEMSDLFEFLREYNIPEENIHFDLFLARGLDYYTGPIFETVVREPKIGSITGGGRYDRLIGIFSGNDQPATGCSIGLERIVTVMDELGMFPGNLKTKVQVLVTIFDEGGIHYSISLAGILRQAGIYTELYTGSAKLRGQFGLANDRSIPLVLIAGPDEREKNMVTLKNMMTGEQQTIKKTDLVQEVRAEIASLHKVRGKS
ncbi:MAG: histidine--tRNA ligase [Calditrichaeota bacterium]|nr:MAG: histidine--tRNA ligase [Calditrichota bacterium]